MGYSNDIFFFVQLVLDIIVVITIPLHIILCLTIWSYHRSRELFTPFHIMIAHMSVNCLIQSIVKELVERPASRGWFREFYIDNAPWVGKFYAIYSFSLSNMTTSIHLCIAINRFTALFRPVLHDRLWTSLSTHILMFFLWILWLAVYSPICISGTYYAGFALADVNRTSVLFWLEQESMTHTFSYISVTSGSVQLLLIYVIYSMSIFKIAINKMFQGSKLQWKLKKITYIAMIATIGRVVSMVTVGSSTLYYNLYGKDLVSTDWYFLLYNLGVDYNLVIIPWIMIILFEDIRHSIGRYVHVTGNSTVQQSIIRPRFFVVESVAK